MAASGSLDSLITKHAAEFAEHVRMAAAMASSEMDVQAEAITQLRFLEKNAGIKLTARHNATIGEGRPDSVYHRVIVEYKNPNDQSARIGPTLDSPGTKKVVEQIKSRFRDLQTELGYPINSLLGVGCDGFRFVFVRWRDTQWDVQPPVDVDRHSAERFLWAVSNLGQKGKPYKPEYLAQDFGSAQGSLALKGIPVLYDAIRNAKSPKAQTFFKQWKILFGEVCGYDVEDPSEKMKKLADGYGIPGKVQSAELLFAVHTYYAIFMKLLAAGIVAKFHNMPGDPLSKLHAAPTPAKFKAEMDELEKGSVFRHFNITNFLEGDLFLWYLSEWSDEVFTFLKAMVGKLDEYVPQTLAEEPTVSRDLLKKLYQELFPKKVRHDLGEYYTPDWLAEYTLNEVGYDGNPDKRVLDPSCGSGTFLVMAINRIRAWYDANRETAGYEEADLARKILSNCIGFDLNPLAVMAARTNYLIAIRGLINGLDKVEIPVYLCDSILTPSNYGGLFAGDLHAAKELKTAAANFIVPTEIAQNRDDVTKYAKALEISVRRKDSPSVFIECCVSEGLPVTKKSLHIDLYKELVALDRANKNGVWANIIKNSFAPLFVGKVDFVVGNPPWVRWGYLPEEYRRSTVGLWTDYGLFSLKGFEARLGSGEKDIAQLMVYACIDHYLAKGGRLAFLITQTVFKAKGQAEGFRRFRVGESGEFFAIRQVDDLSRIQPFPGAANLTVCFVAEKGKKTHYPVKYVQWIPRSGASRPEASKSLDDVIKSCELVAEEARPVDSDRPNSQWQTGTHSLGPVLAKLSGPGQHKAMIGARTDPYGVFQIEVVRRVSKRLIFIRNRAGSGKTTIEQKEATIEDDLIFPLVRGRDVSAWRAQPGVHAIITQNPETRKAIAVATMRKEFPRTLEYFTGFREVLENRGSGAVQAVMQASAFYAMFAVSQSTFAPFKVAWNRMGNIFKPALLSEIDDPILGRRLVLPSDTVSFVPFHEEDHAHVFLGLVASSPARAAVYSFSPPGRGLGAPSILKRLAIPTYAKIERSAQRDMSKLVRQVLVAARGGTPSEQWTELLNDVDVLSAKVFGLTLAELSECQQSVEKRESSSPKLNTKFASDHELLEALADFVPIED